MPAAAAPLGPAAQTLLQRLGAELRARRELLGVSAVTTAQTAGISRVTLHRVETGHPSVTVGAVVAVADAVGLVLTLVDPQRPPDDDDALPARIALADHAQLRLIAWQLDASTTLTPREALSIYERNWRHVDVDALSDSERALVRRLAHAFSSKPLV
jgi:transcriptional regulator with XRE-family HTH domain